MIGVGIITIRLHIRGWTGFQVDLLIPQVIEQHRVLDAGYTMPDARGYKFPHRIPHIFYTTGFSGMRGIGNTIFTAYWKAGL